MTDDKPARRARTVTRGRVERVERLTPHMIRIVLGGEGLAGFHAGEYTDHYVKLLFAPPGVSYPQPFDLEAIQRDLPREQWPTTRTYTVRRWDAEARELTLDVVHHGDSGLAGPWAGRVRPGEEISFFGPGGAYAPDPHADWHLLAGDESALPAMAASLERLPAGAPAWVFVEVAGPEEEQRLDSPGDVKVVWLHRGSAPVGERLVRAVRELDFPSGDVHAFVHGEAGFVRDLRRYLRTELGIPLERLSISGYWRLGRDDESWRAGKQEWNRRIEEEEAAALAGRAR
ncbi:NADPH-dependent ferric siderophore reductase [Streptosporangium becharense]|uniref:NADPH-dependent ferric siderophore reductase n=1 Tax=Streptosporangium becharense TaxID=1816182 RepID=A0A7W9IBZ9_9ACTN|nr:siderophore-interacting protein [Streptosporangium becharense]MBB2915249.1 NADPH-dependent ferric siderophore reductase [Streptosporangium becharense]MBB5817922.1 NADPH-dependent ferric siderophore reductase [Streptosporangium becharense]